MHKIVRVGEGGVQLLGGYPQEKWTKKGLNVFTRNGLNFLFFKSCAESLTQKVFQAVQSHLISKSTFFRRDC